MKGTTLKQLEQSWRNQLRAISLREFNSATKDSQADMLFGQYTIYKNKKIKRKKHFRIPKVVRKVNKIQADYWSSFSWIDQKHIKPNRIWVLGNSGKAKYQING
ncbi:hypothetical protein M2263_004633 [Providencia alcalifaciens]|nr:hypothetical protein [Providencia alcalifaciens]